MRKANRGNLITRRMDSLRKPTLAEIASTMYEWCQPWAAICERRGMNVSLAVPVNWEGIALITPIHQR